MRAILQPGTPEALQVVYLQLIQAGCAEPGADVETLITDVAADVSAGSAVRAGQPGWERAIDPVTPSAKPFQTASQTMGRRSWAITALCGLVTVACGVTAVVAAQRGPRPKTAKTPPKTQLLDGKELDSLRSDLDTQHATQADLDNRAETLTAMFSPDAVNAVAQVQADALPGACALARTAARDATPAPNADSYVAYTVAAATIPALDVLPDRWGRMLDPTQIQAEIDRCAADETAIMEGEAAAAADQLAQLALSVHEMAGGAGLMIDRDAAGGGVGIGRSAERFRC